ncbi:MAG TPA: sarcosine oxidase subunit gamma family protein [Candidatus Acidoferrum sp.]|nr:sarcosine oxidase subunit gamma family protein [Candidatus Acidoferrum sp.]
MIAEAVRRSPLADYRDRFVALSAATRGDILIREVPYLAQINFRADPTDADIMQRLASTLGFALPVVPNTATSHNDRRALWLGPDEWLIVGPDGQREILGQALRDGLNGTVGSIVDISANRTMLEVGGPKARELLSHGVPIDLDGRTFGPDRCAQTLLAKAQVVIERHHDEPFHLYIRSSFAHYAAEWLLDAGSASAR